MSDDFKMPPFNPYWVLGAMPLNPVKVIEAQHSFVSNWFHPDKSTHKVNVFGVEVVGPTNNDMYAEIQEAWRILSNPELRARYHEAVKDRKAQEVEEDGGEEAHWYECQRCLAVYTLNEKWRGSRGWALKAVEKVFKMIPIFEARCDAIREQLSEIPYLSETTIESLCRFHYRFTIHTHMMNRIMSAEVHGRTDEEWIEDRERSAMIAKLRWELHNIHRTESQLLDMALVLAPLKAAEPGSEEAKQLERQFRAVVLRGCSGVSDATFAKYTSAKSTSLLYPGLI
ncbi:hypothetical protein Hte_002261 [Hypoxylon texense]